MHLSRNKDLVLVAIWQSISRIPKTRLPIRVFHLVMRDKEICGHEWKSRRRGCKAFFRCVSHFLRLFRRPVDLHLPGLPRPAPGGTAEATGLSPGV
jgi:hypothetical protein